MSFRIPRGEIFGFLGSNGCGNMPEIVQNIMLVAPNTHFVILAQAILFRDAGLGIVWPQIAALIAIGAALFSFSLWRFRKFVQ